MFQVQKTVKIGGGGVSTDAMKWAIGELEWSALMSMLDTSVCILRNIKYFNFVFKSYRVIIVAMSIVDHFYLSLTSINNQLFQVN